MRYLFCLLSLLLCFTAKAQNNYSVSLIPKELLPYASAIVRNEEITTEIKSVDNVTYHVKKAITVMNKNGDDLAHMALYYDKTKVVKYVKGFAYNEFGQVIKKFSDRDFNDVSAADNSALFEEFRVKHYIPAITQYPYTIECEYEIKRKESLILPEWTPNPSFSLSVQKSTFTVVCPANFNIRYKEINLPAKVTTGLNKDGAKTYTWQAENIKAFRNEPFHPNWETYLSSVVVAPEKFEYQTFKGQFTDWKQLGQQLYDKLLANKTQLPEQTIQAIKDLTANITDPKQKAKKIYEYMQRKTHYISVQVGIGGYEPFSATDVDMNGYGDCKALVNYTRSLLKVAGIDSYYCVVYGDHDEKMSMLEDFASMQGNHIILCVPFKDETVWLECTDQETPFGFLGDFTDDRIVLACTPEGGKLMRTPKYTTEENLEKHVAQFALKEDGTLSGNMISTFGGAQYDDRVYLLMKGANDRLRAIRKYYPLNNMEVEKLEYLQDKALKPTTTEKIVLTAHEYAAVDNNIIKFSINSIDKYNQADAPAIIRNRQTPVHINRGYTEEDEITYTLPKGYKLDAEPLNVSVKKEFGSYTASIIVKDGQLVYKRKMQIKDGDYDKGVYQDVVDFYQSVVEADNSQIRLVKN